MAYRTVALGAGNSPALAGQRTGALPGPLEARPTQDNKIDYASDPALVRACLNNDERAWDALIDRYGPLVYSIARRWGLSAADADDIFQNVFTIAYRRLSSLKNQRCLSAWLITITQRECAHLCKRTPEYADLAEEISDAGATLPEEVESWERRNLVHQALSQLEPRDQLLLKALFLESSAPSYEQIASRLGLALGSIGPARARCLKKLEAVLISLGAESCA